MGVWTDWKPQLALIVFSWVRVLAPLPIRPSSSDALHPTHRTTIATEGLSVNGVPFHNAMRRVMATDGLTHRDKLVYWALLDLASPKGISWPSTSTIAKMIGIDQRGVRGSLGRLVDAGIIKTDSRSGGRTSTRYSVVNPADLTGLEEQPGENDRVQPGRFSPPPRLNQPPTPAVLVSNPAESASDRLRSSQLTDSRNENPTTPLADAGVRENPKKKAEAPHIIAARKSRKSAQALFGVPEDDEDAQDAAAVNAGPPMTPVESALVALFGGNPATVRAMDRYKVESMARTPATTARMVAALNEAAQRGEDVDFAVALFRRRTWNAADIASNESQGADFELTPELKAIFDKQDDQP